MYKNQKLNQKNAERRSLYKPKLSQFLHFRRKVAIARIGSKKKLSTGETLLVTMAIFMQSHSLPSSQNLRTGAKKIVSIQVIVFACKMPGVVRHPGHKNHVCNFRLYLISHTPIQGYMTKLTCFLERCVVAVNTTLKQRIEKNFKTKNKSISFDVTHYTNPDFILCPVRAE